MLSRSLVQTIKTILTFPIRHFGGRCCFCLLNLHDLEESIITKTHEQEPWKLKSTHTVEGWTDPFNQNLHPKLTERETPKSFKIFSLNI